MWAKPLSALSPVATAYSPRQYPPHTASPRLDIEEHAIIPVETAHGVDIPQAA